MFQHCRIDAHRLLYRLLTRLSTCFGAQYVRHLVSPLNKNRRVLSGLILLLFICGISAIRSIEIRSLDCIFFQNNDDNNKRKQHNNDNRSVRAVFTVQIKKYFIAILDFIDNITSNLCASVIINK